METETTFSHVAPPIFDGDNYQAWAVRMTIHLEALDFWEAIERCSPIAGKPNDDSA